MAEPFVAPYGGLLTRTVDEQNAKEAKLKEQSVTITVNGLDEIIRPEAICLRGVDSLSTDDIKLFVDYYINYDVVVEQQLEDPTQPNRITYEAHPIDQQLKYRVQWINDSTVNVAFENHEDAIKALAGISITPGNPNIEKSPEELAELFSLANNVQERETKPYSPTIAFKKQQDLSSRLGEVGNNQESNPDMDSGKMDEDDSAVVIYARQSFQSDRKVKNASTYSRYYLLHGEPERAPRRHHRQPRQRRQRGERNSREQREEAPQEPEEDLFAHKLRDQPQEEDLFAHRTRDRSRSPTRRRNDEEEEDLFAYKMRR